MAGRFNFQIPGRPDASIVNMGTITATSGGFAALVAPGVRNSGTITATLGTVALASGNTFTLDFYGDKLITLGVGDQIAGKVKDVATGQTLKSLVTNEGKLRANGGRVELTAAAARQVVDLVINTSGVIEANSVGSSNGQIVLARGDRRDQAGAGAADADRAASPARSRPPASKGHQGRHDHRHRREHRGRDATIDASGRAGGGKVLIGGDWAAASRTSRCIVNNQSAALESDADCDRHDGERGCRDHDRRLGEGQRRWRQGDPVVGPD